MTELGDTAAACGLIPPPRRPEHASRAIGDLIPVSAVGTAADRGDGFGDVAQFGVEPLGGACQDVEGAVGGEVVVFRQGGAGECGEYHGQVVVGFGEGAGAV
jgi:hypothetical protein